MKKENLPLDFPDAEIRNNIKLIILLRGYSNYAPSAGLLNELKINAERFWDILNNRLQPTFEETFRLSRWLEVNIQDIYSIKIPAGYKRNWHRLPEPATKGQGS